jgi:hypothetical protein
MSEDNNQYWNGTEHAVLERGDISASWGSGDHSGVKIDAANRAFCIYYHAKQSLTESAGEAHWSEMNRTLRDCARRGWGRGVNDLQEALHHIDVNGGSWTDNNTRNYYGGRGKSYSRGLIQGMAEGPASFLRAVDDKLPDLQNALTQYQEKCGELAGMRLTENSQSEWEVFKSKIEAVKTSAERAKPLMWLVPAAVTANLPATTSGYAAARRIEEFASSGGRRLNQSIKFLGVVTSINDGLTVYADATRAMGGDRRAGVAFAALNFALTFVPVLGSFYGGIVSRIPGLISNWTDFMQEYHASRLNPEAHLRRQAARPRPWQCDICGSTGGYT